jgi:DNA-binding LacI/PurR family transcriptional regulator
MSQQNSMVFEVARAAGVSQVTVSRAFSGKASVAKATHDRIMQAAQELGYQPNPLAAGLRGGQTQTIGLVWDFANPWADDAVIVRDVFFHVHSHQYTAYQAQYSMDSRVLCQRLDDLLMRRVDAMVVWCVPDQLRAPEIVKRLQVVPTIVVTREAVAEYPGDQVIHDRHHAIEQVVDHFVKTGRKLPAMAMDIEQESNPAKYKAFVDRCRYHGIDEHKHMLIPVRRPPSPEALGELYRASLSQIMPRRGALPVDAIFCFNDIGAGFMMRELRHRGIDVPQDVAIVGFNNTPLSQVMEPPLATGDRKHQDVALAVNKMLFRRLSDPDVPAQCQYVHMSFLWRDSAG